MIELNQEKYLERRKTDLEKCLHALKLNQFDIVENVGHNMKGNGVTFGFPELSKIGADLELAAQSKNKILMIDKTNELKNWIHAHSSGNLGSLQLFESAFE